MIDRIHVPFDPDTHTGLGWIWCPSNPNPHTGSAWRGVKRVNPSNISPEARREREKLRGRPWIEAKPPAIVPGEDDFGAIEVHLPGGARATLSYTTPEGAAIAARAVLAMRPDPAPTAARDPLTEAIDAGREGAP